MKSTPVGKSAAATLYQQAISSMNRNPAEQTLPSPPPSRGRISPPTKGTVPVFSSAEEEKAALKRYHEAKDAVDRTQGMQEPQSPPLPYDTLYPNDLSRSGSYSQNIPAGMPPKLQTDNKLSSPLSEKEKLRRAYDAQDAAALAQQTPVYSSPPAPYSSPVYESPPPVPGPSGPLAEKELLRRRYEAQDAAALAGANGVPQPPPRRPTVDVSTPIAGSTSILSAVEEKARLKARYEAEERQNASANGSPPPPFGHLPIKQTVVDPTPPPPPPLMPRPPVEYIQETQEEDARVRDTVAGHDVILPEERALHGLDTRPYAPYKSGVNGFPLTPPPPPPLPPKRFTE